MKRLDVDLEKRRAPPPPVYSSVLLRRCRVSTLRAAATRSHHHADVSMLHHEDGDVTVLWFLTQRWLSGKTSGGCDG
ncbi:hypothetical protein KUCAC02_036723 [Chaenocephalus aceratus]|nr:hypothetical protein KUCAC02_036723 [Chaenocephalus aceratus]